MKRITHEYRGLDAAALEQVCYTKHRLAGRSPFVLEQDRSVWNTMLPCIASAYIGFGGRITVPTATSKNQHLAQSPAVEIDSVIESCPENRRRTPVILSGAKNDNRLRRTRLIDPGEKEYRRH